MDNCENIECVLDVLENQAKTHLKFVEVKNQQTSTGKAYISLYKICESLLKYVETRRRLLKNDVDCVDCLNKQKLLSH